MIDDEVKEEDESCRCTDIRIDPVTGTLGEVTSIICKKNCLAFKSRGDKQKVREENTATCRHHAGIKRRVVVVMTVLS